MADNLESLAGVTPTSMADDQIAGAREWRFDGAAAGISRMSMLVLSSDDGFAPHTDSLVRRVRTLGNTRVTATHVSTDHSWSDKRIALQAAVFNWLLARQSP
jgi:hypothetical protein